jgi:hypothetical protein
MRNVFLSLLIISATFALRADAQVGHSLSTGELRDYCKERDPSASASEGLKEGMCLGYMTGWLQGVNGLSWADSSHKPHRISFAEGVTVGQMSRVFYAYVAKHPETENLQASLTLIDAMTDANLLFKTK